MNLPTPPKNSVLGLQANLFNLYGIECNSSLADNLKRLSEGAMLPYGTKVSDVVREAEKTDDWTAVAKILSQVGYPWGVLVDNVIYILEEGEVRGYPADEVNSGTVLRGSQITVAKGNIVAGYTPIRAGR